MFTGLIEAVCKIKSVRRNATTMQLTIDLGGLAGESKIGDSIAVNGACLTIAGLDGNLAVFELSSETLAKSNLANCEPSSPVNIERAMKATNRFGGHIIQGHIDGTATIKQINSQGQFTNMKFEADPQLLGQMIVKGSVAIDGISLTIAELDDNGFSTALIPQSLKQTTLGKAKIGDKVNIETDIIVKAVKKHLENILPQKEKLTVEKLKQMGF